jgi:hemoglobin/transferrin/lactoferrin receptor protein
MDMAKTGLLAFGAALISATSGAIAQTPAPEQAQVPVSVVPPTAVEAPVAPADPITVTATRTPKNQYDVPGSVSVVRKQTIDQRQPQQLDDLLRDLPGVDISGGPRPGAGEPVVRGLSGERVLIRLDGARQDFQSGHKGRIFVDPDLLKQVDVVRGPNSVLYGSGAIGGVIGITTRDASDFLQPGQNFGFRVKTGYQSVNNMFLGQGVAFGRMGGFDGLAAFTYRNADDYKIGGGGHLPFSGAEVMTGLVKAGYTVAPGQRLSASFIIFNNDDLSTTAPNTAATNSPADRTTRQITGSLTYEHKDPTRSWLDLRSTFYVNTVHIREKLLTMSRVDDTDLSTVGFDTVNTSRFGVTDNVAVNFTYGIEGRYEYTEGKRNGAPRLQWPNATGNVFGGFAQPEIVLYEVVSITPGLRYDHYNRSPDNPGVGPDLSEGHVSPRIGIQYDPLRWLSLYALYSEAFRAPSLSELYVSGSHFPGNNFIPNPNLKPEIGRNKEIGVRFKFDNAFQQGDQARFRVSAFRTDYKDFIDTVVTATTTRLVNLSKAYIEGVEFEGGYVSGNWFGTIGASILKGRNKTTDEAIASIPAHKLALTVGYQIPNWDLVLGARAKFVAEQDKVPAGTLATDGYALFDLFVSWQPTSGPLAGARVDLGVDNLTDKRYRDHLAANFDPGRNFKIAVSKQF